MPNLSILENVVLGEDGFLVDLGAAEGKVAPLLADFGLDVSPHTEIRHLALGQRQRVEIIKVLVRGSRVLLLDEPTSVLTPGEVTSLLDLLRRLRDQGIAVVLITHKLGEALAVSDRVTILRGGRNAGDLGPDVMSGANRESVRQRIVEQMFGGAQPAETRLSMASASKVSFRGTRNLVFGAHPDVEKRDSASSLTLRMTLVCGALVAARHFDAGRSRRPRAAGPLARCASR